jgi:hypothetical protein
MIAAIPNIIGWLAISFAKVRNIHIFLELIFTHYFFWKHNYIRFMAVDVRF